MLIYANNGIANVSVKFAAIINQDRHFSVLSWDYSLENGDISTVTF